MDALEISAAPTIEVGREKWPVPELGARQIRLIAGKLALLPRRGASVVTGDAVDALYDVVYIAMTRANPALTRDAFDDMPITVAQLNQAMPVIMMQCGFAWAAPKTGEAQAQTESTGQG